MAQLGALRLAHLLLFQSSVNFQPPSAEPLRGATALTSLEVEDISMYQRGCPLDLAALVGPLPALARMQLIDVPYTVPTARCA